MKNNFAFFRLMLTKLNSADSIGWSQSMAWGVAFRFDCIETSKVIAKKLHIKYPYFATKLADNYGYDLDKFIA